MYKLVAIDLDGTLLKSDKELSIENIDSIKLATKMGVNVVVCTGRPFDGYKKYLKMLELDNSNSYSVAFNSALIFKNDKTIISKTCLKGHNLKEIYKLSLKINANIHAFDMEGVITPKMSKYTLREVTINDLPYRIKDFNKIPDNLDIIKVMLIDEPEVLDNYIKDIPKDFFEKYNVVRSAPFFLEFLNKDADKHNGVKFLAKYLNVNEDEIMTIGDAGNDYKMIKNCKMGVAMKNSMPFVKEVAKYITHSSNNESGVAEVFDKFILNK